MWGSLFSGTPGKSALLSEEQCSQIGIRSELLTKAPPAVSTTKIPPVTNIFPLPERFCEALDARGIRWPQTQRGMMVERPCPKGTRGISCQILILHILLTL